MNELENTVRQLRQYRKGCKSIVRGELPEVNFGSGLVGLVFGVIFCFLFTLGFFTGIFSSVLDGWSIIPAIPCAIASSGIVIFWPMLKIYLYYRKNLIFPDESFLEKYKSVYKWQFGFIKRRGWVVDDVNAKNRPKTLKPDAFRLWLGVSTGSLVKLWHRAGMAPDQHVSLGVEDACQNILALGAIGSGKTTCVMQPLLLQFLDQKCGGLIFDIKGDVKYAVKSFTKHFGNELVILGPHNNSINLLDGLTPEVGASFLKSAFLLSDKSTIDSFWIDTAAELCRNTLGLLSFVPKHYSLHGLYQYLFDQEAKDEIDGELFCLLPKLDKTNSRLLKTYSRYHEGIFNQFDPKIKSGVKAAVARTLASFNHPALIDAFCSVKTAQIELQGVLEGAIFLIDMPLAIWGLGGKVAYTFIKLRFFNLMQSVHLKQNRLKTREKPVFFMCDEFQEIVSANMDGLSDLNFWDKSRSSRTVGIISTQSVASFYAAIGNRDIANALLQNFRQKLCFRTEDPITIEFMDRIIGNARVKKITITNSYDGGHDSNIENRNSGISKSIVDARESVVDAPLFRGLVPKDAVAVLSLDGHSMDDVFSLMPVYPESELEESQE